MLLCVGIVEVRKAQASLATVFRRLAQRHTELELIMVGGTSSAYCDGVKALVGDLNTARVLPVSSDIYRYYHAADLLVSASDIESMPRSFMEAMAFGLPIVSTDVAGCPELVLEGHTGWLAAANESSALEAAIERALQAHDSWATIGSQARAHLQQNFSVRRHGSSIATLLRRAGESSRHAEISRRSAH